MAEGNGDWLRHLDMKFEEHQRWLLDHLNEKLDEKADKEDVEELDSRIEKVESRTNKLAIKQAGISGTVSVLTLWVKSLFTGS